MFLLLALSAACTDPKPKPAAAAKTPTTNGCKANLALADIPIPPPNVPAQFRNNLGFSEFTVTPSDDNGVTNYTLSFIPNSSSMPDDLKDRVADYVKVSICNTKDLCLAIDSQYQLVSKQVGADTDLLFPYWTGDIGLPADIYGSLVIKARACTYVRTKDESSGISYPSGEQCSDPIKYSGTVSRPKPDVNAAAVALQNYKKQAMIIGITHHTLPAAQAYISSLQGKAPSDESDAMLFSIANTIAYDPNQFSSFLTDPMYSQLVAETESATAGASGDGLGLASADDPCAKAVSSLKQEQEEEKKEEQASEAPSPPDPSTPDLNEDASGVLLPPAPEPQVVTVYKTVVETKTMTVPGTTEKVYETIMAYENEKIRVLDAVGNIRGCVSKASNGSLQVTACTDEAQWNFKPVVSVSSSFQIQEASGKGEKQCLKQNGTNVSLAACEAGDESQHFQFKKSTVITEGPTVGTVQSSDPFNFVAMKGGVPAFCVETTANSLTLAPIASANAACTTTYSIDQFAEMMNGMQTWATLLGGKSENAVSTVTGSSLIFGGVLAVGLAGAVLIGAGVVTGKNMSKNAKAVKAGATKFSSDDIKIKGVPGGGFDVMVKGKPPVRMSDTELKKIGVSEGKLKKAKNAEIDFKTKKGTALDANGKPMKTKPKLGTGGKLLAGAAAVGFLGGVAAIAAGIPLWVQSSKSQTQLAEDPKQAFTKALMTMQQQLTMMNP